MKKNLPLGLSSLSEIITGGYHYVDKTKYAHQLISTGKYYFLSRPRRFGKTLFINTLKEIFEGNKKLFEGLYIYDKWDWSKKYPVIHFSFAKGKFENTEDLNTWINELLVKNQERLEVKCKDTNYVAICFSDLIDKAKVKYGQNVVILIDEYDKPILDALPDVQLAKKMRDGLRNLYSVFKDHDADIKFVLLTGVSKFTKVSIFSELNILDDITINAQYSSICGYTESELITEFKSHLQGKDLEEIRHWYNGYSWTGTEKVYNPFSILKHLKEGEFKNYWFETGTPTFLIELFKAHRYYVPQMEEIVAGEELISSFELEHLAVETVLFQTGYLTIKSHEFDGANNWYILTYPNHEVKSALTGYILKHYSYEQGSLALNRSRLLKALKAGELNEIHEVMYNHFETIPHDWYRANDIEQYEGYYSSVFYSYFASIGLEIRLEEARNKGKVDMAVILPDKVIIFEFKVVDIVKDGKTALTVLKERGYAEGYRYLNRPIYLVGIDFSKGKRNIINFEVQMA